MSSPARDTLHCPSKMKVMGPSWPPAGPTQKSDGEGHVAGERAQVVVVILRGGGGGRRGAWRERKQLQQPWLLCGGVWCLPV